MPTSGTTHYSVNRDDIINRALRLCGAIGQGETPQTIAVTEASIALNQLIKEWEADGMQLWKISESNLTMTATVQNYNIGIGATINQTAPNKVLQAFMRTNATNTDQPMIIITRQEFIMLGSKSSQSTSNQVFYNPPGNLGGGERVGTFTLYPVPNTDAATNKTFHWIGLYAIEDFNASADIADFPSYYYNALSWGLADQLSYEYGLPYAERSMINKKADAHLEKALGFDREEGSVYIQPDWQYWGRE